MDDVYAIEMIEKMTDDNDERRLTAAMKELVCTRRAFSLCHYFSFFHSLILSFCLRNEISLVKSSVPVCEQELSERIRETEKEKMVAYRD
jgi:hypothetical protein